MAGKKAPINPDDVIKLYNTGKSVAEITNVFGCTRKPILRILGEAGIPIRQPNARKELPLDEIVSLYTSGESVKSIARKFLVAKTVITRRLLEAGVVMRTPAEANQLMMSKRTVEENTRNVQAAHNAIRGKTYTHEELCQRAISKEHTFTQFGSPYERQIADELNRRRIQFVPQKAVDKYNIDFAIFDSIAFEVFGGGWHAYGRHGARFKERSKKLFDSGYTIVMCWVGFNYEFIPSAIVDYLIALNEILCSDPSTRCKHYMIRGDAQPSTIGSSELNYLT